MSAWTGPGQAATSLPRERVADVLLRAGADTVDGHREALYAKPGHGEPPPRSGTG